MADRGAETREAVIFKLKQPLYVLPHGIVVIGEYAPKGKNLYWRLRIRPHPFFPNIRVSAGGCAIRRSRAILASKLGRALTPSDLAHHADEDHDNDTFDNIELMSADEHNKHHKVGTSQSAAAKKKIGDSLRQAYAKGHRTTTTITERDEKGRIAWNSKRS